MLQLTRKKKKYKMKEEYTADKLIIAKFKIIPSIATDTVRGMQTTTQQYIFELVEDKGQIRYQKVFTGFITDCVKDIIEKGGISKYFDTPYVDDPEIFTSRFKETKGMILPKISLLLALDSINFPKEKQKEYQK